MKAIYLVRVNNIIRLTIQVKNGDKRELFTTYMNNLGASKDEKEEEIIDPQIDLKFDTQKKNLVSGTVKFKTTTSPSNINNNSNSMDSPRKTSPSSHSVGSLLSPRKSFGSEPETIQVQLSPRKASTKPFADSKKVRVNLL